MHMDSLVPPPEPYKAATTIVQGQKIMPALPKGVRRIESRLFASDPGTPAYCLPKARFHCPGIVVREQPVVPVVLPSELTSSSSVRIKPTAAVLPTTSSTSSPANSVCSFSIHAGRSSGTIATTSVEIQTDDVGIDMDLLFHIEDLLRTQRSLTLPMSSSRFASAPVGCGATNPDGFSSHLDTKAQNVKLQQRIEELQEALGAQSKVNADLKRLLVSALAGNSTLADQLIGLTSDNVNLSGQSRSLAAQQAALTEVANTAGIAADVWRAKCLAGRVIATEAARRVALAERKAQLARHALAHLLGERARLRLELGQACASLIAATSPDSHPWHSDEVGTTPPIVQDTLGLAALCTNLVDKHICQVGDRVPILCQSDSPGENLALRVLTNSFPLDVLSGRTDWRASVNLSSKTFECASSSTSGQKTVDSGDGSLIPPPAPPDTEDLIQQALRAFASTQFSGTEHACLSSCKGCRGEVSVV